ncbi:SUMF1/EgtB/PvdO family nonheme iron enzyme, partial [Candidatus Marithrix sp. Canyon 246]
MVRIPAGSFRMGGEYSDEKQHDVSVDSFAMGKYEVTFAEYDKFADATG